MGAGLCDGEGERAYTAYAPHYTISASPNAISPKVISPNVWSFRLIFLKRNDSTKFLGEMALGNVHISSSALRLLGAAYIPILLSEVEQEQRPSGNGDREAIVVGAGLCDGEGERAYIAYAPHYNFAFRKPFSKHDYLDVIPVWSFRLIFLGEMTQLNF